MRYDPTQLPEGVLRFLGERHLATLSTVRADGSLHVVPVGFAWDNEQGVVRIITSGASHKVRNLRNDARAVVSQVDGGRWLTLEGRGRVVSDPQAVALAVAAYAARYRMPPERPDRVTIEIIVDRVLGRA